MLTGSSSRYEPGYTSAPTTQAFRVTWKNLANGSYRLTYQYWFNGDQKDIPGATVYSNSKDFTEAEALAMFGGREVYFGIYGSGDYWEKWESLNVGFINMKNYKVGYNFDKQLMNDDGTYRTTPTEVPAALMAPVTGMGLNGDTQVRFAKLANVFESYTMPTAELTNTPYTPLKEPVLKAIGQNYLLPHSFRAVDLDKQTATLFLKPFQSGATATDRAIVDNYILKVVPKTVDVKIEYVLDDGTEQIIADTVVKTVALGSEVGVSDKKAYVGYALDSASNGAVFDKAKLGFAKKEVGFELLNSPYTVAGGTATASGDNIEQAIFQVIYMVTEEHKAKLADAIAKTKLAAENPTTENIQAANAAIALLGGMKEEVGLKSVTAAAQKVLDYKTAPTAEKLALAQAEIDKVTTTENAANKTALQAQLDAAAWKEKSKVILAKTPETVTVADLDAIKEAYWKHGLSEEAKALLPVEKKLLEDMLLAIGQQEEINLKTAEEAVALASRESNETNITAAKAAVTALTPEQVTSNPDLQRAIDAAELVQGQVLAPTEDGIAAAEAKVAEVSNANNKAALMAQLADAKNTLAANTWKETHKDILSKEPEAVTEDDRTAILAALTAYYELPKEVRDKLTAEKAQLDAMLAKLKDDADLVLALDAVKMAALNSNDSTIAAANSAVEELTATQIAAHPDLQRTIDAAEAVKSALANPTTDSIAAAQAATNQVTDEANKAALQAQIAQAQAVIDADKFKQDHAIILAKTVNDVTAVDKAAVDAALADFEALSPEAKAKLGPEEILLRAMADKLNTSTVPTVQVTSTAGTAASGETPAVLGKTVVSGSAAAGATVTVKYTDAEGAEQTKTTTAADDGTYSLDLGPDIPKGTVLSVSAKDGDKHESDVVTKSSTIDPSKANAAIAQVPTDLKIGDPEDDAVVNAKKALEALLTAEATPSQQEIDDAVELLNQALATKAAADALDAAKAALQAEINKETTVKASDKYLHGSDELKAAYDAALAEAKALLKQTEPLPTQAEVDAAKTKLSNAAAALDGLTPSTKPSNIVVTTSAADPDASPATEAKSTLSGKAEPGAVVTVVIPGVTDPVTVTAKDDGTFEAELPTTLPDGTPISITATEAGMGSSEAVVANVSIDKTLADKALDSVPANLDLEKEADKKVADAETALKALLAQTTPTKATQAEVDQATADLNAAIAEKSAADVAAAKTALKESIDTADALGLDPKTTDLEDAAVVAALTKASEVYDDANATQAQVDDAKAKLDAAMAAKAVADAADANALARATLEKAIADAEAKLTNGSVWTPETVAALQTEISKGKDLLAKEPQATTEELNTEASAVTARANALVKQADKTTLLTNIGKAEDLNLDPTTTDVEDKAVVEALAEAKLVNENLNATQTEVDAANAALDLALQAKKAADEGDAKQSAKTALEDAITAAKNKLADGTAWTPVSEAALKAEIAAGEALLTNPEATTQAYNDKAYDVISKTNALVAQADKSDLNASIAKAESLILDPADAEDKAVWDALVEAKAVSENANATVTEVANAKAKLDMAMAAKEDADAEDANKVAREALKNAIAAAEAKLNVGTSWTPETVEALNAQISAGRELLAGTTATSTEIHAKTNEVMGKTNALVAQADKAALNASITAAENLNLDTTNPSDKAVADALAEAKAVSENANATQEAVDTAQAKLDMAITAKDVADANAEARRALTQALVDAKAKLADGTSWTPETLEALEAEIAAGEALLNDATAATDAMNSKALDVIAKTTHLWHKLTKLL